MQPVVQSFGHPSLTPLLAWSPYAACYLVVTAPGFLYIRIFHWTTFCRDDIIPFLQLKKFELPILCNMNRVHSAKEYYSLDLEPSLVISKPVKCQKILARYQIIQDVIALSSENPGFSINLLTREK